MQTYLAVLPASRCSGGAVCRRRRPPALTGGNGTLYIGGWPNKIFIIDEATEKVDGHDRRQ